MCCNAFCEPLVVLLLQVALSNSK